MWDRSGYLAECFSIATHAFDVWSILDSAVPLTFTDITRAVKSSRGHGLDFAILVVASMLGTWAIDNRLVAVYAISICVVL